MFFTKTSIPERITNSVIAAIRKGQVPPWRRPNSEFENDGFPTHPATFKPFRGVNVLLMNISAMANGFHSRFWGTKQEWHDLRCTVSGRPTALADETPVFNGDQSNSVAHRSRKRITPVVVDYGPAEAVIAASGADIRHVFGLEAAYYYPPKDFIVFPLKEQFIGGGGLIAYYDSLYHELAHFSEPRLGWANLKCSLDPVVNELRAEITAPFVTAQLGLPVFAEMKKLTNHNKHIDRWVEALRQDPTLIFQVAAAASEGVAYLLSLRG